MRFVVDNNQLPSRRTSHCTPRWPRANVQTPRPQAHPRLGACARWAARSWRHFAANRQRYRLSWIIDVLSNNTCQTMTFLRIRSGPLLSTSARCCSQLPFTKLSSSAAQRVFCPVHYRHREPLSTVMCSKFLPLRSLTSAGITPKKWRNASRLPPNGWTPAPTRLRISCCLGGVIVSSPSTHSDR